MTLHRAVEAIHFLARFGEAGVGEIQQAAVMGAQYEQADGFCRRPPKNVAQGEEIAQAL